MYQLIHTMGDVIHTGPKHECEIALKALSTYGIDSGKFEIIEADKGPSLSEATRDKLAKVVAEQIYDGSFGDGLEEDYAWTGVTIIGASEMTDSELIEEYEHCAVEDDELLMQARAELSIETMLKT